MSKIDALCAQRMTIGRSFVDRPSVRQVSVETNTDGLGGTNIFAIEADDAMRFAQYNKLPFSLVEPETIHRAGEHAQRAIDAAW
jgi:hypothetical protein